MKKVFSSASLWQAREILALLKQNRVDATLLHEHMAGTPGVVPLNPLMAVDAEVWVLDPELAPRCERLIAEYQQAAASPGNPGWPCPACGEENPPGFDLCWSCGRSRE